MFSSSSFSAVKKSFGAFPSSSILCLYSWVKKFFTGFCNNHNQTNQFLNLSTKKIERSFFLYLFKLFQVLNSASIFFLCLLNITFIFLANISSKLSALFVNPFRFLSAHSSDPTISFFINFIALLTNSLFVVSFIVFSNFTGTKSVHTFKTSPSFNKS